MAEPVILYPTEGGEPLVCAAPSEARRLVETGEWVLNPPEKPATKARRSKPL